MGTYTTSKAVPYPVSTDPADPRFFYDVASWADASFAGYVTSFTAGPRPKAFLLRYTADTSSFGSGDTQFTGSASEWNTSGGTFTSSGWVQDTTEVQSWWMLGCNIISTITSGTVGGNNSSLQAGIRVQSVDPVTGLNMTATSLGDGGQYNDTSGSSSTLYLADTAETNTGGEYINNYVIVPIYKAQVWGEFIVPIGDGSAVKKGQLGSVLWGVRLGPV